MNKEIKVKMKNIFGVERIYPACELSDIFCYIARSKTLIPENIEYIKQLGFKIIVVQDTKEL